MHHQSLSISYGRCLLLAASMTLAGACGADGVESDTQPDPEAPIKELSQPLLRMVGPSGLSAGDPLTIMGEGFAEPEVGKTIIAFDGVFQGTSGRSSQVHLEIEPRFVNQGVLEWTFGPNVPFADASAQETGTFRGVIRAVNVGLDGERKPAPDPHSTELQVLPSIIIEQLRPPSAGCAVGLTDTTDSTRLLFQLRAIGLRPGTEVAPVRFVYTFLRSNFRISDGVDVNPENLLPQNGPVSIIDEVREGLTSKLGGGIGKKVWIERGDYTRGGMAQGLSSLTSSLTNTFDLNWVETAPLPNTTANYFDAGITILAIDAEGMQARRNIPLRIWAPIELDYDGNTDVVRSFDPVPVSGCLPGGDIGRTVDYREEKGERRARSLRTSGQLGLDINAWVVKASAAFGMDVNAEVASSESKSLNISGKVLPKEFAAFYRQTLQIERRATLKSHGPCGHTQQMGDAILTDWVWSPDLAKGRVCPPLPRSNLSMGEVFKPESLN